MSKKEDTTQRLDTIDVMPAKGQGSPVFQGRQKWDMIKLENDDVVAIDWAQENNFEPFAVSTEFKKVAATAIAMNPQQTQPQVVPISVVWFKRPAIKNEDVQPMIDSLIAKRKEMEKELKKSPLQVAPQ